MDAKEDVEMEDVTLKDQEMKQDGIICDVNNYDRMLELGKLAVNDSKKLMELFKLP